MPILGKRKYINDRIEKLINKLDMLGYDTTEVKKRYYGYEDEEEEQQNYYEQGPAYGGGLPYRDKINDVLQMIENLINQGFNQRSDQQNYYEDQQEYYDYNTPQNQPAQQNNSSIYYNRQPQEFKNNLMYQLNNPGNQPTINQRSDQPTQQKSNQPAQPSTSFNLF